MLMVAVLQKLDVDGSNYVDSKEWGRHLSDNFAMLKEAFGGATKGDVGFKFRQIDAYVSMPLRPEGPD